jgi:hypothetical protein
VACPHAGSDAIKEATGQRDAFDAKKKGKAAAVVSAPAAISFLPAAETSAAGRKHIRSVSVDEDSVPEPKRLKQGFFQVFSGRDQPFTRAETDALQAQALRATVSAGLPFRVWENPEVVKFVDMLRSAGPAILPSRKIIAGRLLDEAAEKVEVKVKHALQGQEIGLWCVTRVIKEAVLIES